MSLVEMNITHNCINSFLASRNFVFSSAENLNCKQFELSNSVPVMNEQLDQGIHFLPFYQSNVWRINHFCPVNVVCFSILLHIFKCTSKRIIS